VPEPATWAFALIGFGAVGAVMRRRGRPAFA
jgi:MYXO-CTERM domain-containing protein